ncbi:hypothetical protein ES703_21032 [subsurface metagenome]
MTWNVVHNFPGAKDAYEVPVDYPDAGYDTIIASWFTDIFTSILAIQEAIIGATSIVLLKAGGTMTGDLVIKKISPSLKIWNFGGIEENFIMLRLGDDESPTVSATEGWPLAINIVFEHHQDIEFAVSAKGIVLKSPGAQRWRIKVSDAGVLSTEAA